jgi:hypothetical protein
LGKPAFSVTFSISSFDDIGDKHDFQAQGYAPRWLSGGGCVQHRSGSGSGHQLSCELHRERDQDRYLQIEGGSDLFGDPDFSPLLFALAGSLGKTLPDKGDDTTSHGTRS